MEKKQFGSLYINKRPVVPAGRQFDRYRGKPRYLSLAAPSLEKKSNG